MKKLLLSIVFLTAIAVVCTAKTFTVTVTNGNFNPKNLTVAVGDKVEWLFAEGEHTTTSGSNCTPDSLWNSGLKTEGMKFDYTFSAVGDYPYFCTPHCANGMIGMVTVTTANGMEDLLKPANITALKNYPNPFINTTTFSFYAVRTGKAQLEIIAADGRLVSVENIVINTGQNTIPVTLDLPSGVYMVRLQSDAVLAETRILARRE